MVNAVKERSFLAYIILSIITFGIYPIIYWTKISNEVNILCEGDGKKTMKYVFAWLLNFVTLGIFGIIWEYQLAKRLQENAARYNLNFSEGGAIVVVLDTVGMLFFGLGRTIASFVMTKNFNKIAVAFNEYNGLKDVEADERATLFNDKEEVTL